MFRTKIICTIGPAVSSYEKIAALVEAGMSVARINFSHGTHSDHKKSIALLKKVRSDLGKPLAIMLDTKGPEIRLGPIFGDEILLPTGSYWRLTKKKVLGDHHEVSVIPGSILDEIEEGQSVLFDDGYVGAKVISKDKNGVEVVLQNEGRLRSNKSINLPGMKVSLPAMTELDVEDIRFGCQEGVDLIAASFIRSPEHVIAIKELLAELNREDILVIAKIENAEGVQHFDSIVQVADGIMIARGDLGVEVPLSQVPRLQKMMIRKCYLAGKPVATATQMLESMIYNPRPTRAEASDVANAIYDGTSCVMLSGETAIGKYPIESVYVMRSIIEETEKDFDYEGVFQSHGAIVYHDVPSSVTLSSVKTAYSSSAKAIFTFTKSGSTARLLGRLRPSIPIVAQTTEERSYHQMGFYWGVTPMLGEEHVTLKDAFEAISHFAKEKGLVTSGDLVVVTAGSPFGISGTTNMIIVENIGDVLVRGHEGWGDLVYGNVIIALTGESKKPYEVRGQILVIPSCDPSFDSLIKEAEGIILQNRIDDRASEKHLIKRAKEWNKSILTRADSACQILKNGQLITLIPEKLLVYKGVVLD